MSRSVLFVLFGLLVACSASPSEGDVQTAIVRTEEARTTATPQATATSESCASAVSAYEEDIEDILDRWVDVEDVAMNTPAIQLPDQIEKMQELRREARAVETDKCTEDAHGSLLNFMNHAIDGYIGFMGDASDLEVEIAFENATESLEAWRYKLDQAAEGSE